MKVVSHDTFNLESYQLIKIHYFLHNTLRTLSAVSNQVSSSSFTLMLIRLKKNRNLIWKICGILLYKLYCVCTIGIYPEYVEMNWFLTYLNEMSRQIRFQL